jgi:hypothetical protein
MANIVNLGRAAVGSARIVGRAFTKLPESAQSSVLSRIAKGAGIVLAAKEAKDQLAEVARALEERNDPVLASTAVSEMLAALPEPEQRTVAQEMSRTFDGDEREAAQLLIQRANALRSAVTHTGDGVGSTNGDAAGFDAIRARQRILTEAAALLGLYDIRKLRLIRDALFMDADDFNAAIERI